ncbi:hypothetical protein [Dactylosporangium sp. NPDC050588]|uniref:hypothetical protein n=1 Tax=Dactylosporangium sp. NPDC050588 TaxID=3157211 RepID=UPI0034026A42
MSTVDLGVSVAVAGTGGSRPSSAPVLTSTRPCASSTMTKTSGLVRTSTAAGAGPSAAAGRRVRDRATSSARLPRAVSWPVAAPAASSRYTAAQNSPSTAPATPSPNRVMRRRIDITAP